MKGYGGMAGMIQWENGVIMDCDVRASTTVEEWS